MSPNGTFFFVAFLQARSNANSRLSNELMTLMVRRRHIVYNYVGLIPLQMSSSPGIVSFSYVTSDRDLHSPSVCLS